MQGIWLAMPASRGLEINQARKGESDVALEPLQRRTKRDQGVDTDDAIFGDEQSRAVFTSSQPPVCRSLRFCLLKPLAVPHLNRRGWS